MQLSIAYELSRDLNVVSREVYSILDYLGDIGGLAGSLKAFMGALILLLQYRTAVGYVSNQTILVQDMTKKRV